jgi:hypothetical protein
VCVAASSLARSSAVASLVSSPRPAPTTRRARRPHAAGAEWSLSSGGKKAAPAHKPNARAMQKQRQRTNQTRAPCKSSASAHFQWQRAAGTVASMTACSRSSGNHTARSSTHSKHSKQARARTRRQSARGDWSRRERKRGDWRGSAQSSISSIVGQLSREIEPFRSDVLAFSGGSNPSYFGYRRNPPHCIPMSVMS